MDSTQTVDDGLRSFLDVFEQTLVTEENVIEENTKTIKGKVEVETLKQDTSSTTNYKDDWLQQILYLKSNLITSKESKIRVDSILEQLLKDDMLTHSQFQELSSISNLWREMGDLLSCYQVGLIIDKRRLIEILLIMYTVKQLSKDAILDVIIQL